MIDEKHTLVILQGLYSVLNQAAQTSGDLLLDEYACLVDISESESGLSKKQIEQTFSGSRSPVVFAHSLEEKELVKRVRSKQDRRSSSLVVTAKGLSRVDLIDEALSLALMESSDRLTERAFRKLTEALFSLASSGRGQCRITTILPGRIITFLCNYHSAMVKESALFGLSSVQIAILILVGGANSGISAEKTAQLLLLPVDTLLLHLETLSMRELINGPDKNNAFALLEEGHRRVDSFFERFEPSGNSLSALYKQLDENSSSLVEDLLGLLVYLFSPQGNTRATGKQAISLTSSGAVNRIDALSSLFALLAQLFSYPSRTDSEQLYSIVLVEKCSELFAAAGIETQIPEATIVCYEAWTMQPEKERLLDLRAEFTRLFYTTPRLVSLNGADWVHARLTDFAKKHGERAAVGLEYRKLSLKNRKGSNEPFDTIVSELDFLSYITSFEAKAFEASDALSAREWEQLRTEFIEHHFDELARGVAQGIRNSSSNECLELYATLLDAVVDYL